MCASDYKSFAEVADMLKAMYPKVSTLTFVRGVNTTNIKTPNSNPFSKYPDPIQFIQPSTIHVSNRC